MEKLKHYIKQCANRPIANNNPNEISTYIAGHFGSKMSLTIKRVALDYICGFCIRYEVYLYDIEVYRECLSPYSTALKKIDKLFISAKIKSNKKEESIKEQLISDFQADYDKETKKDNCCFV